MITGAAYDAAIVGAGVVGCAIARELTRAGMRCALVDEANDIGKGASKANSGILHTGFDAPLDSVEAKLVARGHALLRRYAAEVGIATEEVGALMVAWGEEQAAQLSAIAANARANGYLALRTIGRDELYDLEPALGAGAAAALLIPDEQIICPWTTTLALATEAVRAGCELRLNSRVEAIERPRPQWHALQLANGGVIHARWLVNAAGAKSDIVHRLAGHAGFHARPRRGEFIVFDKLARPLINHILLSVPTKVSKGVLVAPTVYGNVLLGPTSVEVGATTDREVSAEGIAALFAAGRMILPQLLGHEVTATYAGVRPATEPDGYQLGVDSDRGYVWAGGIRSTGVSACLAIAEWVRSAFPELAPSAKTPPWGAFKMPPLGEKQRRPYLSDEAIQDNSDCGRLVCFCERVSRAEIIAATQAVIPARDVDGVRRRTRALMGRCQGFFCAATITEVLANLTPAAQQMDEDS